MIAFTLSLDGLARVNAQLDGLAALATDPDFRMVIGRAGANALKKHFRERNRTPNRLGGQRTNFWTAVGASVNQPQLDADGAVIGIGHPAMAQKYFGGTIVPRKAKALAVPVNAKAHGKSPRVFDHLAFIPAKSFSPGGAVGYLVEGMARIAKKGKRKGQQITVAKQGGSLLYVLTRAVHQDPDPLALPSEATMGEAMERGAAAYVDGLPGMA